MSYPSVSIGARLAAQRRQKGFTQQQLAGLTGITIRTVQRIEAGNVQPQAHTLKLLASALEMDFSDLVTPPADAAPATQQGVPASHLALLHALPLLGLFFPLANIIAPLLIWLSRKGVDPEYDFQARQLLNFQCTLTLAGPVSIVLLIFLFPVGMILMVAVCSFAVIMAVVNIRRVLSHQPPSYPLSIVFLPYPAQ